MFSSAELIEALRRRARRSIRPERPAGEFPPAWSAWLASMRARVGAVTGFAPEAVLAIFLAREPVPPPGAVAELGRWRAFATLWRQEWEPAGRDERGVRIAAMVATLLLHLFFAIALIWLMYARFMGTAPAEEARAGDEHVVQVEFIGEGTPEEDGGGAPQREEREQETAAAAPGTPQPEAATPQPAQPTPPAPAEEPTPSVATDEPPQPQPPAEPAAQPLQVTEVPVADTSFTLPPPRPVEMDRPRVDAPEVAVRSREIEVVEATPAPALRPLPRRDVSVPVPEIEQPPTEFAVREIPAPAADVRLPSVAPSSAPAIEAPELEARAPSVSSRDIPMPAAPAAAAAPSAATRTTAGDRGQARSATAGTPAPGSDGTPSPTAGTRAGATASGSATAANAPPGALPSPRRGDDWGDSTRNRPGGQAGSSSGLFNADGSPRLAGDGRVGGGLPPGTITEDFEKIDRHGTWLKRPPTDYEPTAFDRFWVPHENLLEEWVRRSIKEVLIPIPGTSKSIKCSVVVLALGGACGITDPNLQDVEAGARPPPDVPFKRELQEDQDSLGDPAGPP